MTELAYREPEPKIIAGARGDWEMVIGLEVHAQVTSHAKLFSGASTTFGAAPNSNVSLVDAAMPGMLPVINGFCVEQAVRTGLGLKARDQPLLALRPQELLLSRPAAGLPDQPALPPDRRRGRGDRRHGPRHRPPRPRRAHPSRAGRRQVDPRPRPRPLLRRPQPHRHRPDGDRLPPRHPRPGRSRRICPQAAANPEISRNLRRQHAGGKPARRRQCQRPAQGLDRARNPLRDQEHELDALHHPGHRLRGPPPDRHPRGRRQHRAGDPALRPQPGRDPLDALQGRSPRLPLLPRPRPAAARTRPALDRRHRRRPAGAPRRPKGPLRHRLRHDRVRRRGLDRRGRQRQLFRGGGDRARRQAGRELGHQRTLRPAQPRGENRRDQPARRRTSSAD